MVAAAAVGVAKVEAAAVEAAAAALQASVVTSLECDYMPGLVRVKRRRDHA